MNKKFYQSLPKSLLFKILFMLLCTHPVTSQQNHALELSNENFLEHGDFVYLNSPNYGFTNKMTVAIWFKWNADPQSVLTTNHESEGSYANLITIDRHDERNEGQFWLQHSRDNSKYEFMVKTTEDQKKVQTSTISNSADEGIWYYLVGVYDDNTSLSLKIYLNGVLEGSYDELSGNITPHNSHDRLNFGRIPSGYRLFTGDIDEIRIWKGALTQDEIRQQMFSKQTIRPSELASYWNLDESEGTTADDCGPQNADGIFYSALVDVHSFTTNPAYTISDNDKDWPVNSWAGLPIKTVAGAGVDETNTVASNTSYILTMENAWVTTPVLDGHSNMTWFGIEDTSESGQWVISTAPVSESSTYLKTTTPVSVGPAGAQITVTITSTPSSTNNLGIYQLGSITNQAVTDENFPTGVEKRTDIVWGIHEWGSVTSNIQFSYSNVPGVTDPSQLVLIRRQRDSDTWNTVSATNDVNNQIFTLTGVTSYYEYSIGSNSANPLPVEISSFSGKFLKNEKCVLLAWRTETEVNNYGFEIEKSTDKTNWVKIGFTTGNGNSNSQKEYSFRDINPHNDKSYYRLKQIDNSGSFSYSKTIELSILSKYDFSLLQNFPNPFNPVTRIKFSVPSDCFIQLKIYDSLGDEVKTLIDENKPAGDYEVEFNASKLASGIYLYRLQAGSNVSMKKMILMK